MSMRRVAAAALASLAFAGCPPPEGERARVWAELADGDASPSAPTFRLESNSDAGRCAYIDAIEVVDVEADLLGRMWEASYDNLGGGDSYREAPCLTSFTYGVAPKGYVTLNRISHTAGDEWKPPGRLRKGRRYSIRLGYAWGPARAAGRSAGGQTDGRSTSETLFDVDLEGRIHVLERVEGAGGEATP